jgi:hypothetical protein
LTNTLAYYGAELITAVKGFIVQAPRTNVTDAQVKPFRPNVCLQARLLSGDTGLTNKYVT